MPHRTYDVDQLGRPSESRRYQIKSHGEQRERDLDGHARDERKTFNRDVNESTEICC